MTTDIQTSELCPCGSADRYQDCCQPYHQGQEAPGPEALMRSRYSAFALQLADYLTHTWHPQTRPQQLQLEADTEWLQLQVLSSSQDAERGQVRFIATFREGKEWLQLSENSQFLQLQGRWYYLDGDARFSTLKPGRNDACVCGSAKKFKKCCG